MKQTLHHAALASTLLLATVAVHAADQTKDYGSETRNVAAFTSINLIGPFDVIVTPDAGNTIELSGPRQRFADIETTVSDGTLTVRQPSKQKKGWIINFGIRYARQSGAIK